MQLDSPFFNISLKVDGNILVLKGCNVLFIEASDKFVKFVTPDKDYLVNTSLAHLEAGLFPEFFCRVHKSYIVGLMHINKISQGTILLPGHHIPVGKKYLDELLNRLNILNR